MNDKVLELRLDSISPIDGKYAESIDPIREYLSGRAEWLTCAMVQGILIETRAEFGQATNEQVREVHGAIKKVSALNMSKLEAEVTKHDQLAVIEEIGNFVSPETKALLHPGTTSYDILDTARSYLFRGAWKNALRPEISKALNSLSDIAERSFDILQVGRTHLQDTSPVVFGSMISGYAARIAERAEKCDSYFKGLKGKVSGIVGTGASIDMVIGEGKSLEFEKAVLNKLGLEPDYTSTQIVQKEALADVGHGITTLMHVLGDFSEDTRKMYSSAINEVTSRDNAERLGGSSADATKNNPINWENMSGNAAIVESGMRILYEMIQTDFERDLRGSVQARYQPQSMMAQVYESFRRLNKSLPQLSINEDVMARNLEPVRNNPSEAMVAILKSEQWIHPKYGVGHDFVKEIGKRAKKEKRSLTEVALEDVEFSRLYEQLPGTHQRILQGELELYTGSAIEKGQLNVKYAREVAEKGI